MERVSAADLAEASFDGVGGSHRLAFGEVVAQTGDGGGIGLAASTLAKRLNSASGKFKFPVGPEESGR